ncbi:MAG TPA: Uma2 family endonuclease [Polyangiaceae bacterium]
MTAARHAHYSIADYVRLEEYSNVKHEFLGGQIFAMAGGSPEHAALAAAVIASLQADLHGKPCRVYSSDLRIRVAASGLDTYPDVAIVCGHEEPDAEDRHALTNPVVLVEVLSPSTEAYDRGEKLEHYQRIPSCREVVFLSHDAPRIEVVRRPDVDGSPWAMDVARSGEVARLVSVGCALVVDDVYRDPFARR